MSKHTVAHPVSRRKFIFLSTVGTAAVLGGSVYAKPKPRFKSANEKLNVAIIGAGGRGAGNTSEVASENIVALCDVNERNLAAAAEKYPKARKEIDFRKLFDKSNDIDAVVVSTTEHTHAFATMIALQLGKHVYCEKPLTHSIWEARQIAKATAKAGVVTQMGIQIHAGDNYRRVVELIQSGTVGPVREAHIWVSRAWGDGDRPADTPPVPDYLNWDLWIGPAPMRPYHPNYFVGEPRWYKWWDFGGGTMSDLGAHWMDLPFWALKLDAPRVIEPHGPKPHPETAPASMHVSYEYGTRGDMPPVKVHWYQGQSKPQLWLDGKIPKWDSAALFIGDKGMVLSDYFKHTLLPENQEFKRPDPFIANSIGHHKEWIEACKGNGKTTCDFQYSAALTEANHLGNIAHRLGKRIEWDTRKMKVTNAREAESLIRRDYRKGWKLG